MPDTRFFSRPFYGLHIIIRQIPPMNRWAIVSRPLTRTGTGFCRIALRLDPVIALTQGSREARQPWAVGRNRFAVGVAPWTNELREQSLDDRVTRLEGLAKFVCLGAAPFRHIRFAAPLAADNRR